MSTYIPVKLATIKEWQGNWYSGDQVRLTITPKTGDIVSVNLKDTGSPGGPGNRPTEIKVPVAVFSFTGDVDLNQAKIPVESSLIVKNPISLNSGEATLTLMGLPPNPTPMSLAGNPFIIRYQRKLHGSNFLTLSIDLNFGDGPSGVPR